MRKKANCRFKYPKEKVNFNKKEKFTIKCLKEDIDTIQIKTVKMNIREREFLTILLW